MSNQICIWCGEPLTTPNPPRTSNTNYCWSCQTALAKHRTPFYPTQDFFRAFPAEENISYRFGPLVQLHARYAPTYRALELVWNHSMIIALVAEQLRQHAAPELDPNQVWQAALLHDLGIYRTIDWVEPLRDEMSPYIRHGIIGGSVLRREGFSEEIARVAERHTGVGITRDEITEQKLPLPLCDYVPQSRLEQLICYADKFHSKRLQFLTFEQALLGARERGIEKGEGLCCLKKIFGEPKMEFVRAVYEPWQRAFGSTEIL